MAPESTVFILDDDSAHRKLIQRTIRRAGFKSKIVEASSLVQAEQLLEGDTQSFSFFVVDLNLRDGRSINFIRSLRNRSQHCDSPIFVLSTSGLESDRLEAKNAGATRYIVKDADLTELATLLLTFPNF